MKSKFKVKYLLMRVWQSFIGTVMFLCMYNCYKWIIEKETEKSFHYEPLAVGICFLLIVIAIIRDISINGWKGDE